MNASVTLSEQIEDLARALQSASADPEAIESLRSIADRFDQLRTQYRRDPQPFVPHLMKLGALRERFDRVVQQHITDIAERYYEVTQELTALERERERWREALIRASQERGQRRIVSRGVTIDVRETRGIAVPGSDDPARPLLEESLRAAQVWEEVSQLSALRLARALQSGRLPAQVAEEVRRVCPEHSKYVVRCEPDGRLGTFGGQGR